MSVRRIGLATLGLMVVQLAWILTLPAFVGVDEFDHAYRASAVAHGQWVTEPEAATRGTGAWVYADSELVSAARAECEALPYTKDVDCVGAPRGDGLSKVASGAGRYHPAYYALVGYPSLPFEGRAAVYAMRVVSGLICCGLFAMGLLALRRCAGTVWAWVGAAAALSPMVTYSTAVTAPNGVEIMAGFTFWCACLSLLRSPAPRPAGGVLATAAVAGCLLVSVRSLGPLWCLLIAVTAIVITPGAITRVRALLPDRRVQAVAAVIAITTSVSVWWTLSMGSLRVAVSEAPDPSVGGKVTRVLGELPLWVFQSIAAFPTRGEVAPVAVYACSLVLFLLVLFVAWRLGGRRGAFAVVVTAVLALAVPAIIVFASMDTHYAQWQGRYGLPFAIGLALVAGVVPRRELSVKHVSWLLMALAAASLALSVYNVRAVRLANSPSLIDGTWWAPPTALLVFLTIVGTALLWSPALDRRSTR